MDKCSLCDNDFPEDQLTKRRRWCPECKRGQIKAQKLKCYHKHGYKSAPKGTDEISRAQRRKSYHKNKHKHDYLENIISDTLTKVKSRARKNSLEFDLTLDFLNELYIKQDKKCALTKITFSDQKYNNCMRRPFAPSLDRIDSSKGYLKNNVRFVCTVVNMSLNEFGDEIFSIMCKSYVENTICSG